MATLRLTEGLSGSADQRLFELDPTLELGSRLGALHQLLYTRGGIRPVNAAVEELAKLLLMRLAAHRNPRFAIPGRGPLATLMESSTAREASDVTPWKDAFREVVASDDLRGLLPDGSTQPVWPLDEPFRISRVDVLAEALEVLSLVQFDGGGRTLDPLGVAFDTFLQGRYDHAGGLGTYLTPATVATAMARIGFELAAKDTGGLVGDPCCGTGRFLAAAATIGAESKSGPSLHEWLSEKIVGADQSSTSVAMARVNMLSYGAHHPHIFTVGDSITDASLDSWRRRFRLILTNPPFGDAKYDDPVGIRRTGELLGQSFTRLKIDPAVAFVARCIDLLEDDGVAAIVLPDGVLDGPVLREALLVGGSGKCKAVVEGVISFPTATFAPSGTVAKTSALFLRRRQTKPSTTFLANASHVGHLMKSGTTVEDPAGDDLPEITNSIIGVLRGHECSPLDSKFVATVSTQQLTNLVASSYDLEALDARSELVRRRGAEFSQILSIAPRRRAKLANDIPFVSVLHVDDLGAVNWQEAEIYQPTTPGVEARAGDILVSLLNPRKFRAAVVPDQYPLVQCSAEFGVYRPKIDPYAAFALLQHPLVRAQIAPLGRGTSSSRRRIDADEVLSLVAPPIDPDWEASVSGVLRSLFLTLDESTRQLTDVLRQI